MTKGNKYTCVIAEDNLALNRSLVHHAYQMGLLVLDAVKSGTALLDSVQKNEPDLIITDITLERMDGLSACQQLLKIGYNSPIVIISGSNDPLHLMQGIKLGTVDYIQKPFEPEELQHAITKAITKIEEKRMIEQVKSEATRFIEVKRKYRDSRVLEKDIVFVEKVEKRSFHIYLSDGTFLETSTNLDRIASQCSEAIFYPHKSFLVNWHQIKCVVPNFAVEGNYDILFSKIPHKVPLTRRNYSKYVRLCDLLSKS
jgi:DNA-binding LytR/AlgR family response regulator